MDRKFVKNLKNASKNISAIIDIGANSVRMCIFQKKKDEISAIERLEYPISLGHDVFYSAEISNDRIHALSEILERYQETMQQYDISNCRVISCSAMRQALNKSIVMDMIKAQRGLEIEVLEKNEEKALLYYEALENIRESKVNVKGNFLITYIGTGSIGLAFFDQGKISYTQNIPTGALKMHDFLAEIRRDTDDFYHVNHEYISMHLSPFSNVLPDLDHIVLTGPETATLAKLTYSDEKYSADNKVNVINTDNLIKLYNTLQTMTTENISIKYEITEDEAAILYNTLFICMGLMKGQKKGFNIISPHVDIADVMIKTIMFPVFEKNFIQFKTDGAISCANNIIKNWHSRGMNTLLLSELSCQLYDKMKHFHGLDPKFKLIFRVSALYIQAIPMWGIGLTGEATCSFLENIELFGLTQQEIKYTALVSAYSSMPNELKDNLSFERLDVEDKLTVLKLTAMFSQVRSLCISTGSLSDIKINVDKKLNRVMFAASSDLATLLEKWIFQKNSAFFQYVFGVEPIINIKHKML